MGCDSSQVQNKNAPAPDQGLRATAKDTSAPNQGLQAVAKDTRAPDQGIGVPLGRHTTIFARSLLAQAFRDKNTPAPDQGLGVVDKYASSQNQGIVLTDKDVPVPNQQRLRVPLGGHKLRGNRSLLTLQG